ncbi:rhodanese-like domain-containing protein 9, chloroplastic [Selaginella moellendorffii]|nr:rhodanese-like domain-containing protein 9, chloroplastic [Selaginella moellendorffii]|eukprot:XP_002975300.2 rhodanese-like domain-containing protein 9, chloroplastic [Selaginella moellendorffii]
MAMAAKTHSQWTLSSGCSSSRGYTRARSMKWRRSSNYLARAATSTAIVAAGIKYVDGEEAKKLVTEEGYSVVDVRDKSQFDRAHIKPSTHVPLFTVNTDGDISTSIRRVMHNGFAGLFYGIAFTKPNSNFVADVERSFSKDSKLLLVCQEGLRSGQAAEKLEEAGFRNLAFIDNGLQKVKPDLFATEGPKQLQDAGKAGLVTIQGQFSVVLGAILVSAYLFLTLFPTQAEELFFKK